MFDNFKIKQGKRADLFDDLGKIRPEVVLVPGYWYLCYDTADLYICIKETNGEISLLPANEKLMESKIKQHRAKHIDISLDLTTTTPQVTCDETFSSLLDAGVALDDGPVAIAHIDIKQAVGNSVPQNVVQCTNIQLGPAPRKAGITIGSPYGEWQQLFENYPVDKTFDTVLDGSGYFKGEVEDGYSGDPGIIYTLNAHYDLSKIVLNFSKNTRSYYLKVFVSESESSTDAVWQAVADINGSNIKNFYDGSRICTINHLANRTGIKHIKVVFTGAHLSTSKEVRLHEFEVYGVESARPFTIAGDDLAYYFYVDAGKLQYTLRVDDLDGWQCVLRDTDDQQDNRILAIEDQLANLDDALDALIDAQNMLLSSGTTMSNVQADTTAESLQRIITKQETVLGQEATS